jgi:hypothetical protein
MAPLLKELSSLEVEPLQIIEKAPCREGFYTPEQESSLDRLIVTSNDSEMAALLMDPLPVNHPCCCCCGCCACGCC